MSEAQAQLDELEEKLSEHYNVERDELRLKVYDTDGLELNKEYDELVRTDYVSDNQQVTVFVVIIDELDEGVVF